ncbi:MAG: 3-dehydroquinate synthase [Lachnospiraceae bacterium]|nr:3-dehydroquinate synthase [Lachnospiraceae bacterium]
MNVINVITQTGNYDIDLGSGLLPKVGELLKLNRKVLIVTDDGVPKEYSEAVARASKEPVTVVLKQGEESKNLDNLMKLEKAMLEAGFTRGDCVVAVGGGVIGDLSGFAASIYMRGIDFYNIPTTLLSQVDSSIGGKTAIDFEGVKNIIGAFYPPMKVIIDTDTLKTLSRRQISNGMAEVVKMAATFDETFFSDIEEDYDTDDYSNIIYKAIKIKKRVVEEDEKESGLRRVLNFGHTLGHGIESSLMGELLHGECVGLGMLCMCDGEVRERIEELLTKLNLPVKAKFVEEEAMKAVLHDKKANGDTIKCVYVKRLGTFEIREMDATELSKRIKAVEA